MRIDQQALATHLSGLSLDDRKRLIETFEQTIPKPRLTKYIPKTMTEKQQAFMCMPHREVLYGGAAGGAKTWALLMAALQYVDVPGYSALILRRSYPELSKAEGFIDISKEWLSGTDARWSELKKRWTFPTGGKPAILEFAHYETGEKGRFKQHGGQYQCVKKGTRILMADHSYELIENLKAGAPVMTLQGPKKVTKVFLARTDECIEATVYDGDGCYIGTQIHPTGHKFLTPLGWLSYDDILCVSPLFDFYAPMLFHYLGRSFALSGMKYQSCAQRFLHPLPNRAPLAAQYQSLVGLQDHVEPAALSADDRNDCVASGVERLRIRQPAWLFCPVMLHAPHARSIGSHLSDCVELDAPRGLATTGDSLENCLSCFDRDDAPFRTQKDIDQEDLPSPADVGTHILACCMPDESGRIRSRSQRHLISYDHPYTMEVQLSSEGVQLGACRLSPVGKQIVYDLTVEEVNHYITSSKLVNQNCICIDELTEFEQSEYRFLFRSLRRPEHMKIPLRMRAATNPTGRGAVWVKQYFIVSPDPYLGLDTETGRTFLPAKLGKLGEEGDNRFIDKKSYIKSLMNLDPYTRAQLLDGDWDAKPPGGKFRREWFKFVDVLPAGMQKVRFWDLAATEPAPGKDPDYTVGLLMGLYNDIFYIIDVVRDRLKPRGVEDLIVQTAEIDGLEVDVYMEQEPGSSGVNTIDYYTRLLKKFSFHGVRSTGSKEIRANPLSSQAEAGNVKLLKSGPNGGRWIDDYLDEMELVFHGQHDDQADASSGAYSALVTGDVGEYVFAGGERTSPEW